jgi:hypothetical protein
MANNSYLYANATDDPEAPAERLLLVRQSSNEIPVLWYGLFDKSGVCSRSYLFADGGSVSVPGLIAPTPTALSNFRRRAPALRSWLPPELHACLDEWDARMKSVAQPYIQLDAADAILLLGADDLTAAHVECIEALDTGEPAALSALFDRVALDFDPRQGRVAGFDPGGVKYSLMGYS